jgi:quercetin dioxygenase-like cupin family protein
LHVTDLNEKEESSNMKYTQSGGQTVTGPEDWFTGTVQIDGVRDSDEQSAIGCAHVRFSPGARTAWHHHPRGQTLYVADGIRPRCNT